MIIVSKTRYLPVKINTIVLYREENFFYISRDVYDQALLLINHIPNLQSLSDIFECSKINALTVSWFYENAPVPINILAPYLFLVNGELEKDIELCCGVLNAITNMINVRSFINKSSEIRKSVSFSLLIKEEYKIEWDHFFLSALPYESLDGIYESQHKEIIYSQVENDFAKHEEAPKIRNNYNAVEDKSNFIVEELTNNYKKQNEKQELLGLLETGGFKKEDLYEIELAKTTSQSERRAIKKLLE